MAARRESAAIFAALAGAAGAAAAIDRRAVASRHDVLVAAANSAELDVANDVLTLGNGAFAFNADISGLQTFNASYTHLGVNTLADWGWHSTPFAADDATFALRDYNFSFYDTPTDGHGGTRSVPYMNDAGNDGSVTSWLMQNPHRLCLSQLSLRLQTGGGATAAIDIAAVSNASQALRIFSGALESNFSIVTPQALQCAYVGDNFVATFSCGDGGAVISSVPWASYGQPSGSCAAGFVASPSCDSNTTRAVLAALCVGKSSCSLLVNFEAGFGDPCSGKAKALAANVTCSAPPPPPSATSLAVAVKTTLHPDVDAVAVSIACPGGSPCPLALRLAFPYGSGAFGVTGADWAASDALHTTTVARNGSDGAALLRRLDGDSYRVDCSWTEGSLVMLRVAPHVFDFMPAPLGAPWAGPTDLSCLYSPTAGEGGPLHFPVGAVQPWLVEKSSETQAVIDSHAVPLYDAVAAAAARMWAAHWEQGAFVDLASGSADPAAFELERRVILSQYLLRANDAGAEPPQETGLLCNSWNGKHHNEMRFWHQAHWALWGRSELLARSNGFFFDQLQNASSFAAFEGCRGAHWPKETAAVANRSAGGLDVPWLGLDHAPWPFGGKPNGTMLAWESVQVDNALIMWQQPHVIFLADLERRAANATSGEASAMAVVVEQAPLVLATADYLATRVFFNESAGLSGHFMIGPPVMGGQECGDAQRTFNPVFEVVYTALVLDLANDWREFLGLARDPLYDAISSNMAPLHVDPVPPTPGEPVYTFDDACVCQFLTGGTGNAACPKQIVPKAGSNCPPFAEHPLQLGIFGMINGRRFGDKYGVNLATANNTLRAVWSNWAQWGGAWGWDDSLIGSAMARLGWAPEAIAAGPLNDAKFPFFRNGHTLCCPTYLPGNGGLLLTVAMLAAGSDSSPPMYFPASWDVRAEGFAVKYP